MARVRAGRPCGRLALSVPMNEPRRSQVSMHRRTAIDQDRLSGHEVTVVRSKKQQRTDEVVRCFLAFERPALDVEPAHLAIIVAALYRVTQRQAGSKSVAADALLAQFAGQR